jgi:hypothetical protein
VSDSIIAYPEGKRQKEGARKEEGRPFPAQKQGRYISTIIIPCKLPFWTILAMDRLGVVSDPSFLDLPSPLLLAEGAELVT